MFNFKAQRAHYCCSLNLSPSLCHKGLWQQTHPSVWLIQHTSSEAIRPDRWFTLPRELQREAVFLFHTLDGTESVISLLLFFSPPLWHCCSSCSAPLLSQESTTGSGAWTTPLSALWGLQSTDVTDTPHRLGPVKNMQTFSPCTWFQKSCSLIASITNLISPAHLAAGILLILGIQITQNISIVFLKLTYLEVLDGPRHGKSQIYLCIWKLQSLLCFHYFISRTSKQTSRDSVQCCNK